MTTLTHSHQNELVFVNENKAVTDSVTIAKAFEKGHDKVLRDIRNLKCSDGFRLANFGESSYVNKQGREMPMFIVTQDGFAMLAMGYTGSKAMAFKERYIYEFNRTRHFLESREQEGTLLAHEQKMVQEAVRMKVHALYPNLTNTARMKYFSQMYASLRKKFNVESYRDIPRTDLELAIYLIQSSDSPNLESRRKVETS